MVQLLPNVLTTADEIGKQQQNIEIDIITLHFIF